MTGKRMPRWPLALIAAPAAVAVWSGWVGLGQLCGFGVIHPLPGIWDAARLNTAITLPVGVEAYGAYALGAWLTPGTSERARTFARRSAVGAMCLGTLGQVAYHLLAAAHATRAPWPVVMLVSCLPVVALALGTALAHLLDEPGEDGAGRVTIPVPADTAGTVTDAAIVPEVPTVPVGAPETVADVPVVVRATVPAAVHAVRPLRPQAAARPRRARPARAKDPERVFAAEIEAGELPSLREIKRRAACGTDRARAIRQELARVMAEAGVTADAA